MPGTGHTTPNSIPAPRKASRALQPTLKAELLRILESIERRPLSLRIPQPIRLMEDHAGMHYHFKPEIFVQLRGTTYFRTPSEELAVRPGEIAIMPTGVPHGERIEHDFEPFRNFVIGFYSSSVSMHYAEETRPGHPGITEVGFYPSAELRRIVDLAETLVRIHHSTHAHRQVAARGLMLALFSLLLEVLESPQAAEASDSDKVCQVKWIVRDQLHHPQLSVKSIASQLGCSPDYLSHCYNRETGETLIHYINRQRVNGALEALASTQKSVAEIATACGFGEAGYFTRVFRKLTGQTPGDYRKHKAEEKRTGEQSNWTLER
jgi:AraC-like DNA-binding protein